MEERHYSDSDGTPRDDRFYTPRLSARMGGSSSDGEWATPRSTFGVGWQSDEGEYSTPRDQGYFSSQVAAPKHQSQHIAAEAKMGHIEEQYYPPSESKFSYSDNTEPFYHEHEHLYNHPGHPSSGYLEADAQGHYSQEQKQFEVGYPPHVTQPIGPGPYYQENKQQEMGYPAAAASIDVPYPYSSGVQYTSNAPQPQSSHHYPYQGPSTAYQHPHPSSTNVRRDGGCDEYQRQDESKAAPQSGDQVDRAVDDIFSCARHNRLDEVERLLDKGVPVNVRDQFGNTILAISCQNGNKRVAKAALRRGADINSRNYKGNTPLHFCFTYGYGDTLGQYLISKGADPAMRNLAGLTCYEGLGGK